MLLLPIEAGERLRGFPTDLCHGGTATLLLRGQKIVEHLLLATRIGRFLRLTRWIGNLGEVFPNHSSMLVAR